MENTDMQADMQLEVVELEKRFGRVIGQAKAKKVLNHFLDWYENGGVMPNLFLVGPKGCGKTLFAEEIAVHLIDDNSADKGPREFRVVNCGSFKNLTQFAEFWQNHINDKYVTILFDECHAIPKNIEEIMKTLLNPNNANFNELHVQTKNGEEHLWADFRKQTFIFATTDPQMVSGPIIDRLTQVDLEKYQFTDLAKMINHHVGRRISFEDGDLLLEMAKRVRANGRAAVKFTSHIKSYCKAKKVEVFTRQDWNELKHALTIYPLGLTEKEVECLRHLSETKVTGCSLGELSSILHMTPSSVQRSIEIYLKSMGLMKIDGKRYITKHGMDIVRVCDREFPQAEEKW